MWDLCFVQRAQDNLTLDVKCFIQKGKKTLFHFFLLFPRVLLICVCLTVLKDSRIKCKCFALDRLSSIHRRPMVALHSVPINGLKTYYTLMLVILPIVEVPQDNF